MKPSWQIVLRDRPNDFTAAIKDRDAGWRASLEGLGIDTDHLPTSLSAFIDTWDTSDFILFVKANGVSSRWHFEKFARSVFASAYRRGIIDSEQFIRETGISTRKCWENELYSPEWVDSYLKAHPEMRILKDVSQGLKTQLRKAGLYEYLASSLSTRTSRKQVANVDEDPILDLIYKIKNGTIANLRDYDAWSSIQMKDTISDEVNTFATQSILLLRDPFSIGVATLQLQDVSACLTFLGIVTYEELFTHSSVLVKFLKYRGYFSYLKLN